MTARVAAVVLAAVVLVAGATGAVLLLSGDDEPDRARAGADGPVALRPAQEVRHESAEAGGRWPLGAQLRRRVQLRERPGGRVVRTLGTRTGYTTRRVLAVVARKPGWLGVLSHYMPNSRAGWIPEESATLLWEPYTLHIDLSARRLVVRREGRVVRRITVAVGRPGTTTPTGRFAITDLLRVKQVGGPYGCCAIALTARQPNVPQGWSGGDRIAIHGTSNEGSLGTPASAGCLRASDRDMRWLMKHATVGGHVRIKA